MYAVQATVTIRTQGTSLESTTHIPTFFLDENVQGIVNDEGAKLVAFEVLGRPLTTHNASRHQGGYSYSLGGFVFTYNITVSRVSYRALY